MTLVNIDIRNIAKSTHPDDRVVFRSPAVREASGGGITSTAEEVVPLTDGIGSKDLEPGPVIVTFQCRGMADTRPRRGTVPDAGPVSLRDVIGADFTYTPAVVNENLEKIKTARDDALDDINAEYTQAVQAVGLAGDDALAQVEGAVEEELREIRGVNLANLQGATEGMSLSSDGTLTSNLTRVTTDFIPVTGSTQYVWSHDGAVVTGNQVIYQAYTAEKTRVGGLATGAVFTTTSATRYVRASVLNGLRDKLQLEKGATPTSYVAFGGLRAPDLSLPTISSVAQTLASLDTRTTQATADIAQVKSGPLSALTPGRNLLNLSGVAEGTALASDGSLNSVPTRFTTDFIPVTGSTQYVWSHDGVTVSGNQVIYQAYGAEKNLIGGQVTGAVFTTTSLTRWVRASILNELRPRIQLEKGSTPTPYVAYGGVQISDFSLHGTGSVRDLLAELDFRISALEEEPPAPQPGGDTKAPQSLLAWEQLPINGRLVATAYDGNFYAYSRVAGNTHLVKSTDSGTTITAGMRASDTPAGSNGIIDVTVWEDGSVVMVGYDGRIYRAPAFDATPTLVYQTTTGNTLHGLPSSSYSDRAGRRYIFAGEYDQTSVRKSIYYSSDGGDTWSVLIEGGTLNAGNNHWHSVTYDPYRDAVWVSEGDGDNSKVGVSFDWGETWDWAPQNHPTAMYAMPDRVVMGRDKSGLPPGLSQSDGTLPLSITNNFTFRPDRGSFHFYPYRTSWNRPAGEGDVYYILFPARHPDDTDNYVYATGDGGVSWHLMSSGTIPTLNLAGVDSHGYIFAGVGGSIDSPLYRAKAATWV